MAVDPKEKARKNRKIALFSLIALFVLAGSGGGYFWWAQQSKAEAATSSSTINTSTVRQGDLTLSATGSGTLTAGKTANLSFPIAGTLAEVNVKVGDTVEKGQPLAKLSDLTSLEAALSDATLNLTIAEQSLADLKTNAPVVLANAKVALVTAQSAYDTASYNRKKLDYARGDASAIAAAQAQYYLAKAEVERQEAAYGNLSSRPDDDPQRAVALTNLEAAKTKLKSALVNLNWYTGHYAQSDFDEADANLAKAQAELDIAKSKVALMEANQGLDPTEQAQAENKVANAKVALDKAQQNLDGASMTAPFAGTVLSVAGEVGDTVGTQTFITLIDMLHPVINFSVDESDMSLVKVGETATVTFDAIEGVSFSGKVITIIPALQTMGGYSVMQGDIQLELADPTQSQQLLSGLGATVEVISAQARNALLVPVEAVRDLGDGTSAVFVIGSDGKPRLVMVEAGITDGTFTEIKTGLTQGQVVSTGAMEVNP